jgi:hypothetical protein
MAHPNKQRRLDPAATKGERDPASPLGDSIHGDSSNLIALGCLIRRQLAHHIDLRDEREGSLEGNRTTLRNLGDGCPRGAGQNRRPSRVCR